MARGHRLFCKEFLCFDVSSLCPVVICPYLCTSEASSDLHDASHEQVDFRVDSLRRAGLCEAHVRFRDACEAALSPLGSRDPCEATKTNTLK